jgi:hypothetical protein
LAKSELGPNFRVPTEHSDGEDDDVLEVEESAPKKLKAPSSPTKSKTQGGPSTATLEKKKKKISPSPIDVEDDSLPDNVPVAKKSIYLYPSKNVFSLFKTKDLTVPS